MNPEYIYNETDPGADLRLPVRLLDRVTDVASAVAAIEAATANMTAAQRVSSTGVDLITLYAEEAVARAAAVPVSGNIVINRSSVQSRQPVAATARAAAENLLAASGIKPGRELREEVSYVAEDTVSLTITVEASAADTSVDGVRVVTPGMTLALTAESIAANTADSPLIITITKINPGGIAPALTSAVAASGTAQTPMISPLLFSPDANPRLSSVLVAARPGFIPRASGGANIATYKITFNKPLTEKVTVTLPPAPGDPKYQAVMDSTGAAIGGKYNPATETLAAKIDATGTYTVKENKKDFSDIAHKSVDMQNAITVLASKGIINGTTATVFSPDASISRAEIAALIVRTLSKYNANEDGGFADVSRSDWYFGAAGSAKRHGIMNGTSATIFAPVTVIPKDQIAAVAARVLRTEMNYGAPANVSTLLGVYTDSATLAGWSRTDLALATRENLVVKCVDGRFNPSATMTRGDAAIILYRMFMKIW